MKPGADIEDVDSEEDKPGEMHGQEEVDCTLRPASPQGTEVDERGSAEDEDVNAHSTGTDDEQLEESKDRRKSQFQSDGEGSEGLDRDVDSGNDEDIECHICPYKKISEGDLRLHIKNIHGLQCPYQSKSRQEEKHRARDKGQKDDHGTQ